MSNIQRRINPMTGPSNVARPPMSAMNTAGLTPKEAAGILRRHILMIMLFTFAGLFIGGTSWYLMKKYRPRYTAQAAIEVLPPGKENPLELRSIMPDREIYYQLRTTKAAAMKFQGMLEKLVQQDVIRSTKWYSQFDDSVRDAVYDLKKNLTVSPQRDSTLILVSMTCGNAGESADIVNEMIRLFLMDQKVSSQTDTGDELSKRKSELNKLQTLLGTHNTTLNNMRQASAFGNLNKTLFQDYLEDKLANIERLSDELATSKSELDGRIANLQRRVDSSYDINNSSYDDEIIRERVERDVIASNMRQRISILEVNLASQLAKFGEDHRQVRETRDTIEQAKADLSARQKEIGDIERNADLIRAKEELITLNARIETTENRLTLAKQDHKTLSNLRAEYENTVIKRDETQKDLEKLSNIIQALAARYENSDTSKLRLFQNARKPLEISSPRLKLNLFGGFMLGLLAGVGLAFAIELLNDVLRSPSDVSKHLRVPLLGMISHSEEDEAIGGINLYHVVRQAPYSIMSECY
ncbi:MAG: hypothetical protein KAS23_00510, partial [Anaerohalosphaera sp.]|nr:hypothetical protein [Anaerohalosphaera sp.]